MAEDRELIRGALGGDKGAFDEIVRRYQDGLFRHLLRLTGRPEDAEDLCQETFLRFYNSLRRFNRQRPLAPYLFTIATNVWRKHAGKAGAEEPLDDEQPAGGAAVAEQVLQHLEYQQILAAVGRLRAEEREAVSLYYDQGLAYREIAGITKVPVGTVSTRLRRALEALRQALGAETAAAIIAVGGQDPLGASLITALRGHASAPAGLAPAIAHSLTQAAPAGAGMTYGIWTLWKEGGLMVKAVYMAVVLGIVGGATVGIPRLVNHGKAAPIQQNLTVSGENEKKTPVTAPWLILGAIKNQGMSPMFQSGSVEMLHERRGLLANDKQAAMRAEFQKEVERRLELKRKKGESTENLAKLRQKLEKEADQWTADIVRQQAGKVTYERCLFVGNGVPHIDLDTKTRIDRVEVSGIDTPLNAIPAVGLGTVVTEKMGTPQSICAGYGYGPGAEEAYLQSNEFFPRFQDFGRFHGNWALALSVELMDDPKSLNFSFMGKKAQNWLNQAAVSKQGGGLRIGGQETLNSSKVYIVEVSSLGKLLCKVWIDPARGFTIPRLELYEYQFPSASKMGSVGTPSEVMECSNFVHLSNPDTYFPLLTKYTKYTRDGKPDTIDTYKVFGPSQVAFNQAIGDDAFRIAFKRGMRLEDTRPNKSKPYYADGLRADLQLLPSELAALVDKQDPRITGGSN